MNNRITCCYKCLHVSVGGWSVWGQWAQCSSECGGGIQTRTRTCRSPPEESYLCEGVVEEGRPCNSQSCTGELLIGLFGLIFVHRHLSVSFLSLKQQHMLCVYSHFFNLFDCTFFCSSICVSSISQSFDLRSACWKGDFDR